MESFRYRRECDGIPPWRQYYRLTRAVEVVVVVNVEPVTDWGAKAVAGQRARSMGLDLVLSATLGILSDVSLRSDSERRVRGKVSLSQRICPYLTDIEELPPAILATRAIWSAPRSLISLRHLFEAVLDASFTDWSVNIIPSL